MEGEAQTGGNLQKCKVQSYDYNFKFMLFTAIEKPLKASSSDLHLKTSC